MTLRFQSCLPPDSVYKRMINPQHLCKTSGRPVRTIFRFFLCGHFDDLGTQLCLLSGIFPAMVGPSGKILFDTLHAPLCITVSPPSYFVNANPQLQSNSVIWYIVSG